MLRAVRVLAAAGAGPVERIADAFEEREDVADALRLLQDSWSELVDHVDEVVDPD